jgi:hypothetical protein
MRRLVSIHGEVARLDRCLTQVLVEALAAGVSEQVWEILQSESLVEIPRIRQPACELPALIAHCAANARL